MQLVDCQYETHGAAILAIFNHAILNTTALYEYKPRTEQQLEDWFAAKQRGDFPVIGVMTDDGELAGFASYGSFRAFPAFKYTLEHSVYVSQNHQRQGVAKRLLTEIIERAQQNNYHTLIGAIDATNHASIHLHETLGFQLSGCLRQTGFKFGQWLDLVFYQRILETPLKPEDDPVH